MSKTLYIIRGLPGSGKSTLGEILADTYMDYSRTVGGVKHYSYAADDWFTDNQGNYNFVPEELAQAHEDCRSRVLGAMLSGVESIAVCNTFTQSWEAEPYFKLCDMHDYSPVVVECQNNFGNIHDCPEDKIELMRGRWENRLTNPFE